MNMKKLMQWMACGQVAAGDNPENLKRVCLACCPRLKFGADDTAYIVFQAELPQEVKRCPERFNPAPKAGKEE